MENLYRSLTSHGLVDLNDACKPDDEQYSLLGQMCSKPHPEPSIESLPDPDCLSEVSAEGLTKSRALLKMRHSDQPLAMDEVKMRRLRFEKNVIAIVNS